MKVWVKGCLGGVLVLGALGIAATTLVAPRAVHEGLKFYRPMHKMAASGRALEEMNEKDRFKPPAHDSLEAEQVDRFLDVRKRLDELYARMVPAIKRLPGGRAHGLKEAEEAVETMGEVIPGQMQAFVEAKMTPKEYRYVEALVYGRWRPALYEARTHPEILKAAALEVERTADGSDPALATQLREIAKRLRERKPPAPEGIDNETHQLLLDRLDVIERYSLDAYRDLPFPPPP